MGEEKKIQEMAEQSIPEPVGECAAEEPAVIEEKKSFWKKNKVKIILLAVLLLILLAAGFVFRATRADYVAKEYAKAATAWDEAKKGKLFAFNFETYTIEYAGWDDEDDFLTGMSERYEEDIDSWEDFCSVIKRERKYSIEEALGDFKLKAETKSDKYVKALTFARVLVEDLDDADAYDALEVVGMDWDNPPKIKQVNVRVRIDGKYDNDYFDWAVYLIQSGIGWKVIGCV